MLKKFINTTKYVAVIGLLIILFRGFIYRNSVSYSVVNTRDNIRLTNKVLINEIDQHIDQKNLNIEEIISLSNKITSKKLNFTFNKTSYNPNLAFQFEKANCQGYASLFNAIGNYILVKQRMANKYEFNHVVGKLNFLGISLHIFSDNPFFKDHDFNEIKYKETNVSRFVDPSLRDYFRIEYVSPKIN